MVGKIIIEAPDVWGYFYSHREEIGMNMFELAENPEYGVVVFLTDDVGLPAIIVVADDVEVYSEAAVNELDCEKTVERIYDNYLTEKAISNIIENFEDDELSEDDQKEEIEMREMELDGAVYDFVSVALDGYVDENSKEYAAICEDLKDHFLEYMARKHDLPVRRPMILEFEDGEEYVEFPYECMEFEDEDNPIYKKS